jgi:Arginase family
MVADFGDIPIDTFDLPKCMDIITQAFCDIISNGCRPVTLGGDHTISKHRETAARHFLLANPASSLPFQGSTRRPTVRKMSHGVASGRP